MGLDTMVACGVLVEAEDVCEREIERGRRFKKDRGWL